MRKTGRLGATVLGWLCMVSAAHAVCTPETSALESRDDADTLLVLLHAYNSDAASLEAVKATAVAANLEVAGVNGVAASGAGQTDVFTPELPFGLFSMARPEEVLADLLYRVDCLWQQRAATGRPYRRVLLIGHSMGALYAPGTDKGTGWKETRLKPEFFEKPDEVKEVAVNLVKQANELQKVAATGDKAAIKVQFGETGKACKGCHDKFRKDEEKK